MVRYFCFMVRSSIIILHGVLMIRLYLFTNADEPLDARAIKALKPNVLKDYLKDRDLSTQGQKKDLIQRLIDYENERAL